jgi:uncharacterized protein (DUF305 family)
MKNKPKPLLFAAILIAKCSSLAAQHSMEMVHNTHIRSTSSPTVSNPFIVIMDTMMVRMEQVPRGKSDEQEFLLQMVPHHQAAIEMAKYEISRGQNFEMIQLAKSIFAEQQTELSLMNIWLKEGLSRNSPTHADFHNALDRSMIAMMKGMPQKEKLNDTDMAFASVMLPHHQAAVDMAKAVLQYGQNQQVLKFASQLISNEQIEIQQMFTYIK